MRLYVPLQRLQDMNLNVFAELDACFYIDQGYFSQKHLAAELHIYDAIAVHGKLMKFSRSQWNRLAKDRDLVLCLQNTRDIHDGSEVTVRVTPEVSTFVDVSELCSDDTKVIKLNYKSTWRNMGVNSECKQYCNKMYLMSLPNRPTRICISLSTLCIHKPRICVIAMPTRCTIFPSSFRRSKH